MPTLTTKHLILRLPHKDDFDLFAALWGDADMLKDLPFEPQTRAESWPRFLRLAGSWALLEYGTWFVFDKAGGFVGLVGFMNALRGHGPDFDDHPELNCVLSPAHMGKGYATEACLAALAWMDQQSFGSHTVCLIASEHTASIRVAEKCGYKVLRNVKSAKELAVLMTRNCPV
ncbi:MAG: GNAT family N-acetyltransferase [Paracoccaceae bacterium]